MKKKRMFTMFVLLLVMVSMSVSAGSAFAEGKDPSQYDRWIWFGDSRTVGMQMTMGMEAIALVGAEIPFFYENVSLLETFRGCNIVFNLGVNDIGANLDSPGSVPAQSYLEAYRDQLSPEFFAENNVIFMAINPLDGKLAYINPLIEEFNDEMWRNLPEYWTFLDTYSWLVENGFSTVDGVHYTNDTYQALYYKVTSPEGYAELIKPFDMQARMMQRFKEQLELRLENCNSAPVEYMYTFILKTIP